MLSRATGLIETLRRPTMARQDAGTAVRHMGAQGGGLELIRHGG